MWLCPGIRDGFHVVEIDVFPRTCSDALDWAMTRKHSLSLDAPLHYLLLARVVVRSLVGSHDKVTGTLSDEGRVE
jgi:hypothetical protein